jgi:serine/threonine-protein phosphatase 5
LADAEEAIRADPTFIKGYYRKGSALLAMLRFKPAMDAFKQVLKLKNDPEAKRNYDVCAKAHREAQFAAAIASDMTASAVERTTLTELPSSWAGPAVDLLQPYDKAAPHSKYSPALLSYVTEAFREQRLQAVPHALVQAILVDVHALLHALPAVVEVPVDERGINVCGDTHGQYFDVLNIFKLHGMPSDENPYLFNGDIVDRGSYGWELALVLLLTKLVYPKNMHIARGNHESVSMTTTYGFKGEVLKKGSTHIYDLFTEVFNALPVAHTLNGKVLVLHGGLFDDENVTLEDLKAVQRFRQPPEKGILCDALWSDPGTRHGRQPPHRGCGVVFGEDVTRRFLEKNNLSLLVRSHEMREEGYSEDHNGACVTIFSAPDYCGSMGNKGALLKFSADCSYEVKQFTAVPHPGVPAMAYANRMMQQM